MADKTVAVLDFGSEKIRVLIGSRGLNGTFDIKGSGVADYAGFMNGEFLEPDELKLAVGVAINNAESNSAVKINNLYIGVPAEFSFVNCVSGSINFGKRRKIKKSDILDLVARVKSENNFESHTVIDYSPIYYVLDSNAKSISPIGLTTSVLGANICVVQAENTFIETVVGLANQLDLDRIEFLSSPLATAKYLCDDDTKSSYAIIIDCGHITTSVSLLRGEGLLNMFSFSMGSGNISADLAQCLKLPYTSADELKKKVVLSIDPQDKDVYDIVVEGSKVYLSAKTTNEIVCCRLESIVKGIRKCIDSFTFECPDYTPIYLTGGGISYIKGAKDYVSKLLGKNVELLVPSEPQLNKPHFSSILGLLSSAITKEEVPVGIAKFFDKIKTLFGK